MGNLVGVASSIDARYPIAVLVSGSGTNLQALIDASANAAFGARIAVVISDRPGVGALDRADSAGLTSVVVAWRDHADRESFTAAVCEAARAHDAEALVLAGFMRILSRSAIESFPNRIVNTHPALLPAFPGARAVADALAHGVKLSGVTIHFVDEEVDHGPIITQEAVRVDDGDDEASLHAKIQEIEHRLYPEVVDALARDLIEADGRRVTWNVS
jgi:phosphoribosylglycinamide formyltransferase-1